MMRNQQICGNTRLIGLLGHPVAHSLSPQIQNHALATLALPYAYIPLDVAPAHLPGAVAMMRSCGFLGANVTIPHKQNILDLCDTASDLSKTIGAVNTLSFVNGKIHGTSTDADGFFAALASVNHEPTGGNIVILGNGGTARTIGYALALQKKPRRLVFIGRNKEKVETLADEIRSRCGGEISAITFESTEIKQAFDNATLCVNTTNAGMHPDTNISPLKPGLLKSHTMVLDAVYNPPITLFMRQAIEAGCEVQNGLRMLIGQAMASLEIWTGREISKSIIDIDEVARLIPAS